VNANFANDYLATVQNASASGSALSGQVTGTFNAVGGVTTNPTGLGLYGVHLSATGAGASVWGASNSSAATAILGTIPTPAGYTGWGGFFDGDVGVQNGGFLVLSDSRLKTNVLPLNNALERLLSLNTYTFNYIDDEGRKTHTGFIAQEVKEIFPDFVSEKLVLDKRNGEVGSSGEVPQMKDGLYNVVDYMALIPVLVEAIKEQDARIKALEAQIQGKN